MFAKEMFPEQRGLHRPRRGIDSQRLARELRNEFQNASVVDGVGNQAQWNALRIRAAADEHEIRLVEISRPGYRWRDNREPVCDVASVIHLANNGSLAAFAANCKRLLVELLGTQ